MRVILAIPIAEDSAKLFPALGNAENCASGISKAVEKFRAALEQGMGHELARWTLHDIRRTVATNMQRMGIRLEVTEAVLNHISGSRSGIVGIYQRHAFTDEKRHALNVWALELMTIAAPSQPKRKGFLRLVK